MSEFILGDCMEYMKDMADNAFELAIVDPPYSDTFTIAAADKAAKVKNYNLESLQGAPGDDYFNELKRVSKNQIIWGVNYYKYWLGVGRIVWDKDNTGVYSDCELAYHSFGNVIRKFTFRWNGMLQGNMKDKEIRIHPTQKPVALYRWLLKNYAKPGDKILDTHVGSAGSLIACYQMGFEYLGFEIDEEYYNKAVERLEQVKAQTSIFDLGVSHFEEVVK